MSRFPKIPLLVLGAIAVMLVANHCGDPPTRANCAQHPNCRIVEDVDLDGEIADDLRRARNELLYEEEFGPEDTIHLFAPTAGTYTWTGEVRFCGDASDQPTGEAEPDCDGTDEIPIIRFRGGWQNVVLEADCPVGDATPNTARACLHVGDRLLGEVELAPDGETLVSAEPSPVLRMDQMMVFDHVASIENPCCATPQTIVAALWLDGVTASTLAAQVQSTVPFGEFRTSPGGAYISATDSTVFVRLVPGSGHPPMFGLWADGPMSGSALTLESDFSTVLFRPSAPVMIGSGIAFFDGCAYGPDPLGSCTDFSVEVMSRDQSSTAGQEVVFVQDGDDITLDVDIVARVKDHIAIELDADAGWWPPTEVGSVGDVTLTGSIVYDGGANTAAIRSVGTSALFLDAQVHLLSGKACFINTSSTPVVTGPSYECIEDAP